MLQQTQVATVIPYYERFLARFPEVRSLAQAPLEQVLACWSGLGYYARARHLHRAAGEIMAIHDGVFPRDYETIARLPGIGRSTAGAICAFAFGERRAILDGNVKRLLVRYFAVPSEKAGLWQRAEALLPERDIEIYTQALMDLGATLCTRRRPACGRCPLQTDCVAFHTGQVGELPRPRLRRVPRIVQTQWLILLEDNRVLLERRPPKGVWGGLWCFPELPEHRPLAECCRERYGVNVGHVQALPPFAHAFTHFTLAIAPWLAQVKTAAPSNRMLMPVESSATWLALDQVLAAAVPSPVKRILQELPRIASVG
jgi:A/G-specific adenine glycosylase